MKELRVFEDYLILELQHQPPFVFMVVFMIGGVGDRGGVREEVEPPRVFGRGRGSESYFADRPLESGAP